MRRRKPINWKKTGVTAVLVIAALALALPFVVPLKPWFPDLESQLTMALGEQVKFTSLRAGLLPRPYLEAGNVTVGEDNALRAVRARLYPDLLTLSEATIFVRTVDLSDVTVSRDAVQRFFSERKPREGGLQRIRIGHVNAAHVKLDALEGKLGEFDAEADLNRDNLLTNFSLASIDGRLKFDAVPASGALLLTFSGRDWQPPAGPAFAFDRIYAQGALSDGKLAVSEFTAGIYGGDVRGGLELTWGANWNINGRAQVTRMDVHSLLVTLQSQLPVKGTMEGDLRFTAAAKDSALLTDALKLDGKFKISNGVLSNFDFSRVIQGVGSDGARGGQTRFEQFTGNVQTGKGYRFTNLQLVSGKMTVAGSIDVTATNQVSGPMSVELKGAGSTLGSTVQASGTLNDPVMLPGK
jgi:uncharacterized protein involved in outer membrane biogenesis